MAWWLVLATVALGQAEEPKAAITLRLIRPDRLDDRVNALFAGTRAPHPAAALAGWRRATGQTLSKPFEAAIALFNPDSAREMAAFDELSVAIRFDAETGSPRWSAIAPKDDGSIDAGITALVLTGGGSEPALENGVAVDRLGQTAGLVLASRSKAGGLVLASSREDLISALARLDQAENRAPSAIASGVVVALDPAGFPTSGSLTQRRIGEALRGSGCLGLEALATIEGNAALVTISGRFREPISGPRIEPNWLRIIPSDEASIAFSLAIDHSPKAWNARFELIDKLERVEPEKARQAPARVRLNLIAAAAGVRPEADLWPAVRGVSGFAIGGAKGRFEGGLIALHTSSERAAAKIETEVIPKLARSFLEADAGAVPQEPAIGLRRLGTAAGKPILTAKAGSNVLISWGSQAINGALRSIDKPDPNTLMMVRASATSPVPDRFVAVWPGRLPGLSPRLSAALAGSSPATWRGAAEGASSRDEIRWDGLKQAVAKFMEGLPWKAFEE